MFTKVFLKKKRLWDSRSINSIYANYYFIYQLIFDILDCVYSGCSENTFIPPSEDLQIIYEDIFKLYTDLDSYPVIKSLKIGQYNFFRNITEVDFNDRIKLWCGFRQKYLKDVETLKSIMGSDKPDINLMPLRDQANDLLVEHNKKKKNAGIYVDKKQILNWHDFGVDLINGKFIYQDKAYQITIDRYEIKFILPLLEAHGRIVDYKMISAKLGRVFNDKQDVYTIKRDFGNYLHSLGIRKNSVNKILGYIKAQKNTGYQLV